jgi:hypothetical protein
MLHLVSHPISFYQLRSIRQPQVSEMEPGLIPLQVTGTYLYDRALTSTKSLSTSSPQGSQPTPSQDPPWEEKTISCHCDLRGENVGIKICTERGSTRRMEPGCRRIVRNDGFVSLYITESSAVLYNHFHVLRYLFMRRRP